MTYQLARLVVALGFSGALITSLASCMTLPAESESTSRRSPSARPIAHLQIAQLKFGREAYYAACAEPACPKVTRKTLASTADSTPPELGARSSRTSFRIEPSSNSPAPPPAIASAPLPRPKMEKVETHVLVTFASSSAFLADDAKGRLRQVLPFARTANRIVISGRTDDVGDKGVNEKLALARALAVRNFLRDEAPDLPGVISIDARGLCCFVAPNDPPGRAKNRRVELVFMGNEVM